MFTSKTKKVTAVLLAGAVVLSGMCSADMQVSAKAKCAVKKMILKKGQKKTIKVKGKVKGAKYSFKSSKAAIAKVSAKGVVTAKKAGKAVITVRPVSYVKGYEFSWSTRRDMKKAKVKRTHSTKLTISRLTKNKTYYIRVRAYRNDSTGKRVYGKWSDIRTLRIKK